MVALGKAHCGQNREGGHATVMTCHRNLQSVRKVVPVNEFRTSQRSSCCGVDALLGDAMSCVPLDV